MKKDLCRILADSPLEASMRSIFEILHELFELSEEDLKHARERNMRHVLSAMRELKREGVKFPESWEIRSKLFERDHGMSPCALEGYVQEAKALEYLEEFGQNTRCFVLTQKGLEHLGFPA